MSIFDKVTLKRMSLDYLDKCSSCLRVVLTDSDAVAAEHSRCFWAESYMSALRLSGGM